MASARIELSDRLVYWTAPHAAWTPNPEWPEDVGCVLYVADDALVLIDPLVRDDRHADAWAWLDERVAQAGLPVAVLLTAPWHRRSADAAIARYDASSGGEIRGIDVFAPGGVGEGQVAYFLEPERTLVVAEFFVGTADGLRVAPSPATTDMAAFAASLRELERLPIDRVLVSHGPPVLEGGADAIAAALDRFPGT